MNGYSAVGRGLDLDFVYKFVFWVFLDRWMLVLCVLQGLRKYCRMNYESWSDTRFTTHFFLILHY